MIGAGAGALLYALVDLYQHPVGYRWLLLAGLTLLTSSFSVKIPGVNSKISIGDTFYFTNLILFGPSVGVVTATMEGIIGSLRSRSASRRLQYSLFNMSAIALSAIAGGSLFFWMLGRPPLYQPPSLNFRDIALPVAILGFVHYILNSGFVAAVIALETRKRISKIWKENFLWTPITYIAGAAVAGLAVVNARSIEPQLLVIIIPVIVAVYYTYKVYLEKVLELNKLYLATVESLAMAIDAKDQVTHGHVRRVQILASGLARAMGMRDEESLRWIEAAALLHDIGKLAIPEYILNKPGKLTPAEFKKLMAHSSVGGDILSSIKFPYDVARDVRHHHEHWDGSGYPDGLKGGDIPLGARILSIVDAFDAMTCDRPYRSAMGREEALSVIRGSAGSKYDPEIVEKFDSILDQLLQQVQDNHLHTPEIARTAARRARSAEETANPKTKDRRVFQDIVSTHKEVSALYDLAQTLGSTLNLEETLPIIAGKIARLVPLTTCVIYLYDSDKGTLTAEHVSGTNLDAFRGYTMEYGQNLSGWVAANNHPAINADPVFDILPLSGILDVELTNALILPMYCDSECLGVISIYGDRSIRYDDDHVRVMEVVSKQAARAVHNATKYEETQVDALTDRLTSLPNSRFLEIYFEKEVDKSRRFKFPLCVLAMDLDRFKHVNDSFGHHVGDMMLIEVARAMSRCIRATDIVTRYGGDEFVAVVSKASPEEAVSFARRIEREVEAINLEFRPGEFAQVGISIGLAFFPEDGATLEFLLQKADQAMYLDKQKRARQSSGGRKGLELVVHTGGNKPA